LDAAVVGLIQNVFRTNGFRPKGVEPVRHNCSHHAANTFKGKSTP
jgi:hypothetical protein